MLVNLVANLLSPTFPPKIVKLDQVLVAKGNFSVVKSVLSQLSCNVWLYIIFYHSEFVPISHISFLHINFNLIAFEILKFPENVRLKGLKGAS